MKPARPLDLAAIRARATAPMHFDAISARGEIPWLCKTVVALADEVERLRAAPRHRHNKQEIQSEARK